MLKNWIGASIVALAFAALGTMSSSVIAQGDWPSKPITYVVPFAPGRQYRHARAHHRSEALGGSRPARRRGEQARRGRQHRLRFRGQGEAGRLHDPRRHDQLSRDQPERLSENAVRRGQVVRARDPDRQQPAGFGRGSGLSVQDVAGRDRRGQGEARNAQLRVAWKRHVAAPRGRAPQNRRRRSTLRTCRTRAAARRSPTSLPATCR